ncbi:MAG TPA: DUF4012 domain-containing protein [Thermomicrobiaceae bacterium]|nr:DUF4012 domain-containing protein [Thermomicrobiaceae bacterium]
MLGWSVAGACVLILTIALGVRGYDTWLAYRSARQEISALQALSHRSPSTIRDPDLQAATSQLDALQANIQTLSGTLAPPVLGGVVPHVPWIGPRYIAARRTLVMASDLVAAGQIGVRVGEAAFAAFNATGAMSKTAPSGPTWLDVLHAHAGDVTAMVRDYDRARAVRATIDANVLPGTFASELSTFDRLTARVNLDQLAQDLPAISAALGENGPTRYMLLFQNWAELRPAGGFPGTVALVTFDRGQIRGYQFFDVHDLSDDYVHMRTVKLPEPYPIAHYFPQDGFLIQDATWFANFPTSARQFMSMYAQTDWPSINGVVAIEPSLVSDLLRVTGPMHVNIDGQDRLITADNVYSEIERPRRLQIEGIIGGSQGYNLHKEALSTIGQALIDRLKISPRGELLSAGKSLFTAANARDVQFYSATPAVESLLDQQRWSGRLEPDPGMPTLAVVYGNLVTDKSSTNLQPDTTLTLSAPSGGRIQATLALRLKNTGTGPGTDFYEGFQDWWIQLVLPTGSRVVTRSQAAEPDPQAPNGGAYRMPLAPGQSGSLTVVFSMPQTNVLLLRRQPGVATVQMTVAQQGCSVPALVPLTADRTVELKTLCP